MLHVRAGFTAALFTLALAGSGCDQGTKGAVEGKPGDKAKAAEGAKDKDAKDGAKEGAKEGAVEVKADGPGGSAEVKAADGTVKVEAKDGTKVEVDANADSTVKVNVDDKTKVDVKENGDTKVESKDGDVDVASDKGVKVTGKGANKGDEVTTDKDGGTTIKSKDGTEVKVGKDGKVDLKGIPGM